MKSSDLLLWAAFLLLVSSCKKDVDDSTPAVTFGTYFNYNNSLEQGFAIKEASNGGYMIVGYTDSSDGTDLLTVRTDKNGLPIKQTVLTGGEYSEANDVAETSNGFFAVGKFSEYNGQDKLVLTKLSKNGDELWSKLFSEGDGLGGYGICKSKNGNYAIVGTASYNDGDQTRVFFALVSETGEVIQSGAFPSTVSQSGIGIASTPDGGFIITGGMEVSNSKFITMFMKLNAQGQRVWTRTVDEGANSYSVSVAVTSDGGYAAAGYYFTSGFVTDMYVVKVNSNGDLQWSQTFGSSKDDAAFGIVAADDDVVVSGYIRESDYKYKAVLIRLDEGGYEKWTQTWQLNGASTLGRRLCATKDGGFALTGITALSNEDAAVLLLKTDENGLIQ